MHGGWQRPSEKRQTAFFRRPFAKYAAPRLPARGGNLIIAAVSD
ncbi:hypothetical protein [Kingella potus]|nr:hypothetical protein [Kingella potus]